MEVGDLLGAKATGTRGALSAAEVASTASRQTPMRRAFFAQ
jgi:hypothetical protein